MPIGGQLGMGLRNAGSILSEDVYRANRNDEMLRQQQSAQADNLILEQTIKAMSEGRLDPQQGMPLVIEGLKRKGASPEIIQTLSNQTFGPSLETQQAEQQKQIEERAHQVMDQDPLGQQYPRDMFPDAKSRRDAILSARTQSSRQEIDTRNFNETRRHNQAMESKSSQPGNEPLIEIFDPNSPTKTRFVPRSQAIGQPGKPSSSQTTKPLPPSLMKPLLDNKMNLSKAKRALALIEGKRVGSMSGDPEATGWKGYLPDAVLQRVDPEGVDTRAALSDIGSMVIHDRSGAAVTAQEFPRLRPFIPSSNDDPATVKKKLKRFVEEYQAITDEMESVYSDSGYQLPGNSDSVGSQEDITEDDIKETARANGMTEDEVREELRKQGRL